MEKNQHKSKHPFFFLNPIQMPHQKGRCEEGEERQTGKEKKKKRVVAKKGEKKQIKK